MKFDIQSWNHKFDHRKDVVLKDIECDTWMKSEAEILWTYLKTAFQAYFGQFRVFINIGPSQGALDKRNFPFKSQQ